MTVTGTNSASRAATIHILRIVPPGCEGRIFGLFGRIRVAAQPLDRPAQTLQGLAELRILNFTQVPGEVALLRRLKGAGLGQGWGLGAGQAALLEFEPRHGAIAEITVDPL